MPIFIIETVADSPIREFWQIEAGSHQEARAMFSDGHCGKFLWDEVTGEETNRDISEVHTFADLASTIALHNAQQEGPAMLAALRALLHQCEYIASESPEAMQHPDLLSARAILARIDGAAPAPTASAPVAADKVGPMVQALELAEGFIAGFEDDETQEGVDWLLATIRAAIPATPTAQPAGAIGEAGGDAPTLVQFHLTGEQTGADDMADELERIAGMLRNGFTSGESYLSGGGWWHVEDLEGEG